MFQGKKSRTITKTGTGQKVAALVVAMLLSLSWGCGSAPAPSSKGKGQGSTPSEVENGTKAGSNSDTKFSNGKAGTVAETDQAMKTMQKQMDIQMMPKDKKK